MYLTNSCSHCFWFLFIVSLSISCFFTLYFSLDARALDARALQQVCSNAHEHQLRLSVGIPRAACLTTSVEVVFHCHRCREALPSGGQDDVGYAKVLRLKVRRLLPVVVFIVPEYTLWSIAEFFPLAHHITNIPSFITNVHETCISQCPSFIRPVKWICIVTLNPVLFAVVTSSVNFTIHLQWQCQRSLALKRQQFSLPTPE